MFILINLIAGAAMRLYYLTMRGTFWFDEVFTVHYSGLPWHEAIKYWTLETNPPLHTLFMRYWIGIFSDGEFVTRLSSVIFAVASIWMLYYFGKTFFNKYTGNLASFFLSFSGLHIFLSTEARAYSLNILLCLISFFLFFKIFYSKKQGKKIFLGYFLIQLAMLYTHLTLAVIPIVQLLCLFILQNDKKEVRKFVSLHIIAGLLFAIWFIPSILSKSNVGTFNGWFFTEDATYANVYSTLMAFFAISKVDSLTISFFVILLTGLICALVVYIKENLDKKATPLLMCLAVWAFIPPVLSNVFGIYIPKYSFFSAPALFLIFGFLLSESKSALLQKIIPFLTFSVMLVPISSVMTTPVYDAYSHTKFIEEHETENSVVVVVPFNEEILLKRYYNGNTPIVGFYPREDELPLEERIVRYNWQELQVAPEVVDKKMRALTDGKDKVFFSKYILESEPIEDWLKKNGWKYQSTTIAGNYVQIFLLEYDAPADW